MANYVINNTFEAENIATACINPNDVSFDLWNTANQDFTAEHVNVVDALAEQLIDLPTAAGILKAAGMEWVVCADCSDPEGQATKERAEAAAAAIPAGLEPVVLSVEEYLNGLI